MKVYSSFDKTTYVTEKIPNSHTQVAMALNEKVAIGLKCLTRTCCLPILSI